MATLPSLVAKLVLETAGFSNEARRISRQINDIQGSFNKLNSVVRTVGAGLGVLGAGVGVTGLARISKAALDTSGNMGELAAQTGVTTRDLQVLQFAAAQSGVEFGTMASALAQFARRVGEAAAGNKAMAADFRRMGLSLTDNEGHLRTSAELFAALAERVQNAGDKQAQVRIATEALGRAGAQLLPILQGGSEAVAEFGRKMEEAGLIMSGQMIAKADQASDAIAALQFAFSKGLEIGVVRAFNVELNTSADQLSDVRAAGEFFGVALGTIITKTTQTIVFFSELNKGVGALTGGFLTWGEAIAAPLTSLGLLTDAIAEFLGATKAPDTSIEALAPPAIVARLAKLRAELEAAGEAAGGSSTPFNEAAASMAKLSAEANRENEQLQELLKAHQGVGSSIEDVTDAMKIDDELRARKITRLQAEKSGLLEVLVANQRLTREIERQRSVQGLITEQRQTRQEAFVATAERKGDELLKSALVVNADEAVEIEMALSEPFENALEDIQGMFTDTFDDLAHGAIMSFEDAANSINDIFVRMAANISTLAITAQFNDAAKKQFNAMAAQAGLTPGQLTALSVAPSAIGTIVGLTGNQGAQQGMGIGGGIGGLAGTGIGFALGGPAGGMLGGLIGQTAGAGLGALFGGLFGGGDDERRIRDLRGGLGDVQGTSKAVEAVKRFDAQMIGLLSSRQEAIVDQALRDAAGVSIRHGKEGPSAGDLESLARGRVGPAAQALGLDVAAITTGTAEEQFANLQAAVELMRQIESIRIGPVAAQFGALNDTFDELVATAARLGLSTVELEQQRQRETQALERQVHLERIAVSAQVGALDPFTASIQTLHAQMQIAAATANDLGISTRNLNVEFARQAAILGQQERIRRHAVMGAVGVMDDLTVALQNLDAEMRLASIEAERLGISTAGVAVEQRRRAQELVRQSRLERIAVMDAVGIMDPLTAALQTLQVQMEGAAAQASRFGISTATVAREQQLQANILVQEERLRRHDIMLQVGAISEFGAAIANLNAEMQIAINEANRLGIATGGVHLEFARQVAVLTQQERIRQHGILEAIGAIDEFDRALLDLHANMTIARVEAERLGFSTAGLDAEFARLAEQIERQSRDQMDSLALSIIEPFERLRGPLEDFGRELEFAIGNPLEQMQTAAEQFRDISQRALGGDIAAIEQFQGAGQRFIEEAGRFGASPAQVAAIEEVTAANRQLMENVDVAQREASAGVEDAIRQAQQRNNDKLSEVVDGLRIVADEVKRLGRI